MDLQWCSDSQPESSYKIIFRQLFVNGSEADVGKEIKELERGRSILDTVLAEARKLNSQLGPRDQEKLDEYLTSVRELEVRLNRISNGPVDLSPRWISLNPRRFLIATISLRNSA